MAEISLKNIYKSYGKTEVIHGISCDIADGEFVVLLGPSGCGKSTLLRMIAGLEKITAGELLIGGKVVNDLEPMDRDIAMVFQNYALYPHMTVYKNMAYGLKIRKMSKSEIDTRVQNAAEILGLTTLLDRKPRQLSGGQRQRVAMGRCIVREPQVFLFDEPLSNLDAKLRIQMRLELRSLHERMGITSTYVTHDQVEAMTLGDRLVIIHDGHAEQIGSPLDVYERPSTVFVAGFIGSPSMNFLDVRLNEHGDACELPGGDLLALSGNAALSHKGRDLLLGVRPEHFEVDEERSAAMHLRVSHVETLGADTLVYGYLGTTETFLTIRLSDIHHFQKDAVIPLRIPPEKIHLFDKDSQKRIQD
ncbi:sn-glycerol-3-phosphate ABC transporter ATP-binding protein UgpC [candidate division KSB3 bacterium]|uniref:sn-glycerol-3-phosphate ABC transporter ATP-binding protein UgpC n=1 Tax=candidate division KSB3 bacterium TaxID=2044937 RepID=A0A2G6E8A4_9BACT|nr:MAG: sn-glycerol-3-phosphate ABC transporter ATP-binding protein UgpC [candidate division KSB3 bacterium]PIE30462.1 MAG: sn-glycerol-3-phosphate ABC transporter ATP-binding protein UgpC [candidate division KSB3 bacterium]